MLGNFSLLTHPCDISSLFLKGEGSSRSESKQAQGAGMKLIQHCYNDLASVPFAPWTLTIFINLEFIAVYITLIGLASLSLVLFLMHVE